LFKLISRLYKQSSVYLLTAQARHRQIDRQTDRQTSDFSSGAATEDRMNEGMLLGYASGKQLLLLYY